MSLGALIRNRNGAGAAEFALVLPLLLIFLFGIIDVGRYMWSINRAEKAAQMGVRMAVVTDYIASTIGADYLGQCSTPLTQGDPIPADCFATITCSKASANATCTTGTADNTAFLRVANQMRIFMPEINDTNVEVIYSPSGLGYAGDPNGPDLAPVVTVRLYGMAFQPIAGFGLGGFSLPEVRSSLTFEDGSGTVSN